MSLVHPARLVGDGAEAAWDFQENRIEPAHTHRHTSSPLVPSWGLALLGLCVAKPKPFVVGVGFCSSF